MFRILSSAALPCAATLCCAQAASTNIASASCTFQDGQQMSVRYNNPKNEGKNHIPEGRVWSPGGAPIFLFTQTELTIGNAELPVGAYSMYFLSQRDNWTLIVNKNVTQGAPYDEHQDLVRVPMQSGQLSTPQPFQVSLGHLAPKQCNLRIYYGKIGTWVEFKEK